MKTLLPRTILTATLLPLALTAQVTALRIGHLVDPENGTVANNQVVLVENGRFTAIGGNVAIPPERDRCFHTGQVISPPRSFDDSRHATASAAFWPGVLPYVTISSAPAARNRRSVVTHSATDPIAQEASIQSSGTSAAGPNSSRR